MNATPEGDGLWFNVGVYGTPSVDPFDPVIVNRNLESEVTRLEGRKMLYAQSFYTPEEFWSLFNKKAYEANREKYHSTNVFPSLDKKLLMGEKRIAEASGIKPVNLLNAWPALLTWYISIWGELLLPRVLQPCFNIRHTGLTSYTPDNTFLKKCLSAKNIASEWGGEPLPGTAGSNGSEEIPQAPATVSTRTRASSRAGKTASKRS